MKTKVTIVCENSIATPFPLIGEHGLSVLIESDDTTLFDTGQGLGILHNLKTLGKDINTIQRIILSHGHYDHTGGLMQVLQAVDKKIDVYAHPDVFTNKVAIIPLGNQTLEAPIGIKATKEEYSKAGAVFHDISGLTAITPSIKAIAEINRPQSWTGFDTKLKQKFNDASIKDDPFNDDCSLILYTELGAVVLLGCAHAGIVEILHDISEQTGIKEFYAVLGGTHLESAPEAYITKTIDTLKHFKVKKVGTSHCTGFKVACRLSYEFKDSFVNASCGAVFEF
ncbi:MAG TPA: MBL fold metallo-hydrolase [Spirochaetota bacterium]|nr:MBL fold metallo-hydrolase [Spirochaetota bacterium]HQG42988.1 MBL fold metallo-hydrolase [Spirochaetota bacterium]